MRGMSTLFTMYTASFAVRGKPDPQELEGLRRGQDVGDIVDPEEFRYQACPGESTSGRLSPEAGRKEDIVKDEPVDRRFRTPLGKPALDIE
eukprot:tig00021111_g18382.t1